MRVCFLGDSFVNGTGDDDCLGWAGRLCAAQRRLGRDLTMYNLGVRRDTSEDIGRRWRREAEARLPSGCGGRLVFSFGMNDCAPDEASAGPRISPDMSLANAQAMLAEAASWLPTLVVAPPPVALSEDHNERIVRLAAGQGELCAALGVPFISTPLSTEFRDLWRAEALAGDGVHPNRGGYAALAEVVATSASWGEWLES